MYTSIKRRAEQLFIICLFQKVIEATIVEKEDIEEKTRKLSKCGEKLLAGLDQKQKENVIKKCKNIIYKELIISKNDNVCCSTLIMSACYLLQILIDKEVILVEEDSYLMECGNDLMKSVEIHHDHDKDLQLIEKSSSKRANKMFLRIEDQGYFSNPVHYIRIT